MQEKIDLNDVIDMDLEKIFSKDDIINILKLRKENWFLYLQIKSF